MRYLCLETKTTFHMRYLIPFCCIMLVFSCGKDTIIGEGPIESVRFDFEGFDKVMLNTSFDLTISQNPEFSVIVNGQQNIIDRIKLDLEEDRLTIDLENGNYQNVTISIEIKMPDLVEAHLNGSGDISINSFNVDNLSLINSGSGTINALQGTTIGIKTDLSLLGGGEMFVINHQSGNVAINSTGSGSLTLRGNGDQMEIRNTGAGEVLSFDFPTSIATVASSGSGDTQVNVSDELDVSITGSGDVYYVGMPMITSSITGTGELIDAN